MLQCKIEPPRELSIFRSRVPRTDVWVGCLPTCSVKEIVRMNVESGHMRQSCLGLSFGLDLLEAYWAQDNCWKRGNPAVREGSRFGGETFGSPDDPKGVA